MKKNSKKSIILVILLITFANFVNAQNKWKTGLTISPVMSKVSISSAFNVQTKYNIGATAGVDFYRLYGENFMFKTGLHFNLKNYDVSGNDYLGNELNHNSKEYFITLPLRLQYNFKIKEHQFFVNSGIDVSWRFKSVSKHDNKNYINNDISLKPTSELYFGIAYMYKVNDNFTFTVNPEYSPVIFKTDYSTFRLNFAVIFNY
jgi:hypothetical protein